MAQINQIVPGITININGEIFRVESCVKISGTKGSAFIKTKLRNLMTEEISEKNFKPNQEVKEVSLIEHTIEYLYPEGKDYLFLDIDNLEKVLVSSKVLLDKINFLKEGIRVKAFFYGESVFSIELPMYLELMVVKALTGEEKASVSNTTKEIVLETGATVSVPLFIEVGDIIKIDTTINEFIQRV